MHLWEIWRYKNIVDKMTYIHKNIDKYPQLKSWIPYQELSNY